MNKYIIKNCPAIYKKLRINENNELYIDEYRCKYQTFNACQDCTDCIMKRIVSRLNNFAEDYGFDAGFYADELLSYLDIQEAE